MRVLLLNIKTRLYFVSPDAWTSDPAKARDFETSLKAAIYAQEHCPEELEVCLDFEDTDWNVHLPVQTRKNQARAA